MKVQCFLGRGSHVYEVSGVDWIWLNCFDTLQRDNERMGAVNKVKG